MDLECKIERVEASLLILESQVSITFAFNYWLIITSIVQAPNFQLSSIPWLNSATKESQKTVTETDNNIQILNLPEVTVETEISVVDKNDSSVSNIGPKASEDPRFTRFFKMIHVGVPLPAVKLKMESEGVDSSILE